MAPEVASSNLVTRPILPANAAKQPSRFDPLTETSSPARLIKPLKPPFGDILVKLDDAPSRAIALYLDFDGTIAELVDHHADAAVDPAIQVTLAELQHLCQLAIVTGRDPEDARARVELNGIPYAGNHGLRIIKSDGEIFAVRHEAQDQIEAIDREMVDIVAGVPGALIERKHASRVLHYRRAAPPDRAKAVAALKQRLRDYPGLLLKSGKMVEEVQPKIHWHKGFAIRWLNDHAPQTIAYTLYLGDDRTDEDAFVQLGNAQGQMPGAGILIAKQPRPSAAAYRLPDVPAVAGFLTALADWLKSRS